MRILLISGKAGSGKDTAANIFKDILEAKGDNVLIAHYADLVKYYCKTFFDWSGVKDEYGRHLLQYIGTDVVRTRDPDYWVNFILDVLDFFPNEWDWVIIPDTRFPNEISRVIERGHEVTTIRVERGDFASALTDEQQNHVSETALDNVKFNYYLDNSGDLDLLKANIENWIKENTYE